jgi:phage N-6-adenine-methyltransferase
MSSDRWVEWTSVNTEDSTDGWGTPPRIWRRLSTAVSGFDLDPASGAENVPIADQRFTIEDDGLAQNWFGDVWVNPPYSNPTVWIEKAVDEHNQNNTNSIMLLVPARTNTNWFSDNIEQADAICFLDHKVKFQQDGVDADDYLPTPVCLIYFGEVTEDIVSAMNTFGWVIEINEETITLNDF